jgi:pimeloyl-ACP methyl ester carboxylesterase
MICLDTILESPRRAIAFAWVGGGIGGFEGEARPYEQAVFARAEAAEAANDAEAMAGLEVEIWVDGIGQPPTRVPSWIREAVREMDLPLLNPDRIMGRPIPLDPPANDRLAEIRVPLLAVVGALDTSDTLAAAVRLEEAVPGTRRVVLPGVAHMVGMEAPERLAGLIADLVAPLGTWA